MLVALHGFTENDEVWREVLDLPRERLACPLLPGHGFKPCPPGLGVASLADEIATGACAGGCDLLGYSMGGRIALHLALDRPKQVRRLILISSGPGFRDDALQGSRRHSEEIMAEILEEGGLGPFVAWWEANPILKPAKPLPRAVEERVRSRRLNHDPLGLAGALRRLGAGAMPNLWDRLGAVRAPTLLIAGAADQRYCEVMADMAKAMPDARLAVVPDAGHAIHREQAAAVRELVLGFVG
ncbi:MAG: alpha/beta fold hydrolase [Planctomycetes bacterium]|nr:alpha/beta fold hydrolase [Planctomycetota bacterium]